MHSALLSSVSKPRLILTVAARYCSWDCAIAPRRSLRNVVVVLSACQMTTFVKDLLASGRILSGMSSLVGEGRCPSSRGCRILAELDLQKMNEVAEERRRAHRSGGG